jgi:hypothetical protein
MTVRLDGNAIRLEGRCHVEDAEPLLALLQAEPGRMVDCSRSESLHTAVVQVLIALAPTVMGESADGVLRQWVMPALTKRTASPDR